MLNLDLIVEKGKTIVQIIQLGMCRVIDKDFVSTGVREFDLAMDGGLRSGELVVISGQTGQGKTTFAQTLTCNFSKNKVSSLWFSYEMMDFYLADKFKRMGITYKDPIYSPINLASGALEFVEATIKEAVLDEWIKSRVFIIDHLHYLIPLGANESHSSLAIGGIVRGLKQLAIKYKVIIILIAHTKKIYQDEELDLSSVRDSSLVCQEADYVFLVERQKEKKKQYKASEENVETPYGTEWLNTTRVKVAKNRRTGKMFHLDFIFQNEILIPITRQYAEDKQLETYQEKKETLI